jgi:LmbE family N-acetylglucosaminyl deacetylase
MTNRVHRSGEVTESLESPMEAVKQSFLFVSPHLDDAVLSCGALIAHLAPLTSVTVATIFTHDAPGPHTRSARKSARQCGWTHSAELFEERRKEDAEVLTQAGAGHVHLGFPDALFRRRPEAPRLRRSAGRLVPELEHIYPTYRFHVARGRISALDADVFDRTATSIYAVADSIQAGTVFFPMGIGRHVDHVMARTIGEHYRGKSVFYADFPYALTKPTDIDFTRRNQLAEVKWSKGLDAKLRLIFGYRTQAPMLFPDGAVPTIPERYYMRRGTDPLAGVDEPAVDTFGDGARTGTSG